MKLIKEKKIYTGNGVIENGYIRFDEKIEEVGDMAGFEPKEGDLEVSCAGTMVVPGFIDIHSHGGYGKDNMDATPDEIDEMVKQMTKQEGITTYFCTTMTQTYENIEKAMQNIHDAAQKNPVIKGIHLEGPFISTVFKGAQDPSYIKKPDEKTLAKWNEISGGLLRIVTYAPEEADPSFETWCKENGVVLSAGPFECIIRGIECKRSNTCDSSLQCTERTESQRAWCDRIWYAGRRGTRRANL